MSRLVDIMDAKDGFVLEGNAESTLAIFRQVLTNNGWDFRKMGKNVFRASTPIEPGFEVKYVDVTIRDNGSCAWLNPECTEWTEISAEKVDYSNLNRKLQRRLQ